MAAADRGGSRRMFAVACGVLSRCVKAEAAAGKMMSPAANSHPAEVASTMLLMPGADVVPDVRQVDAGCGHDARRAHTKAAKLTIMYGGRVLVFDDFPAETAAELVRVAARAGQQGDVQPGGRSGLADLPVARKGSLQRFMEKRRGRLGATAPYSPRPSRSRMPLAANVRNQKGDAGCWLVLGTTGSSRAAH